MGLEVLFCGASIIILLFGAMLDMSGATILVIEVITNMSDWALPGPTPLWQFPVCFQVRGGGRTLVGQGGAQGGPREGPVGQDEEEEEEEEEEEDEGPILTRKR